MSMAVFISPSDRARELASALPSSEAQGAARKNVDGLVQNQQPAEDAC